MYTNPSQTPSSRPKAYATTHAGAPRDRGLRLLLGGRSFALAFYTFPELLSARIGGIRRLKGANSRSTRSDSSYPRVASSL
jgi:hypothetical protein